MKRAGLLLMIFATVFLRFGGMPAAAVSGTGASTGFTSQTSSQASADIDGILKEQEEKSGADQLPDKVPDSARQGAKSIGVNGDDQNSLARFTPANLLSAVLSNLKSLAKEPVRAVASVLGILLACALLGTLKNSMADSSMNPVFNIVAALGVAAVILVPLTKCVSYCAETIRQSANFLLAFLPVYSALAAASGHPASAIATQSLLLGSSELLTQLMSTTFIPMVDLYLGFCIVASVSPGVHISGIASFIKSAVSWALTLSLTIYTGILTVQGVLASATDNVTIKTAKFVVDGAIPVVGGTISDAVNTVISCAGLLKTSVGAYAIVVLVLAFLPPVLQCVIWLLAAELSLAAAEILGIDQMQDMLKAMREALKLLIALVLSCALAMIISVSVMLLLGK